MNLKFESFYWGPHVGDLLLMGGGELRREETLPMDQYLVSLCGKENPKGLFIPTASFDSFDYWKTFQRVYGRLGCDCDSLFLSDSHLSVEDIALRVSQSDFVYVGGGSTRRLLEVWKEKGLDDILFSAWQKGLILGGLSAGALCWFEGAISDSSRVEGKEGPSCDLLPCLAWVKGIMTAHWDTEKEERLEAFQRNAQKGKCSSMLALEENIALHLLGKNGKGSLVRASSQARMSHLSWNHEGEICSSMY